MEPEAKNKFTYEGVQNWFKGAGIKSYEQICNFSRHPTCGQIACPEANLKMVNCILFVTKKILYIKKYFFCIIKIICLVEIDYYTTIDTISEACRKYVFNLV